MIISVLFYFHSINDDFVWFSNSIYLRRWKSAAALNASWLRPRYEQKFFHAEIPMGKWVGDHSIRLQNPLLMILWWFLWFLWFLWCFSWILHCNMLEMLEMIITHGNPVRFLGMTLRVFFHHCSFDPCRFVNIGLLSSMIIHDTWFLFLLWLYGVSHYASLESLGLSVPGTLGGHADGCRAAETDQWGQSAFNWAPQSTGWWLLKHQMSSNMGLTWFNIFNHSIFPYVVWICDMCGCGWLWLMLGFLWELQELNQAVTKQQAVALQAFRTFDLDKDGSLSRDELVRGTVKSMVPKRYPKS